MQCPRWVQSPLSVFLPVLNYFPLPKSAFPLIILKNNCWQVIWNNFGWSILGDHSYLLNWKHISFSFTLVSYCLFVFLIVPTALHLQKLKSTTMLSKINLTYSFKLHKTVFVFAVFLHAVISFYLLSLMSGKNKNKYSVE